MEETEETQVVSKGGPDNRPMSYREKRFVESYLRHGNGTRAVKEAGYSSNDPSAYACQLMAKRKIKKYIEEEKKIWAENCKIERNRLIEILIGMATARPADFAEVLKNPSDVESYANLGLTESGISSIKVSEKYGTEIKFIDRRAVINDIWDKLGFDKESSGKDRGTFLGEILGALSRDPSKKEDK